MRRALKRRSNIALVAFAVLLTAAPVAFAAAGTISSSSKYAWSNIGGWVNFAPSNSIVTVTYAAITGYAWSANDGWINLSPTGSGVTNDGKGNLSGFAWDSLAGWVSFSGVTIDSSGKFHGEATGANSYAVNFDCSSCNVVTTWRPAASNPTTPSSPGSVSVSFSGQRQAATNLPRAQPTTSPIASQPPSIPSIGGPGSAMANVGGAVLSTMSSGTVTSAIPQFVRSSSTHTATTSTQKSASVWPHYAVVAAIAVGVLVLLAIAVRFLLIL
jgi:hypothetical protein